MRTWLKKHRLWVFGALGVIIVACAAVWWFAIRPQSASANDATTTQTVAASTQTIQKTVTTTGTLTPAINTTASFAASGTIKTIDVEVGDTVTEGQKLATIDTLQLTVAKSQAKSDLETAKALLAEAKSNADGTDSSDAQIANYTAQVAANQATYDKAVAAMSDATLKAPAAGQVAAISYAVGDQVTGSSSDNDAGSGATGMGGTGSSSTATGITIVGTDSWLVTGSIDATSYTNVKAKLQAEITLSDTSEQIFGVVKSVDLVPDTSTGVAQYPYTIKVTGTPKNLHDGMSADVAIVYQRRTDVLAVPTLAITMTNGRSQVNKVNDDGSVTATTVTTGESSGQYTEITEGLAEGDKVQVTVVTQSGTGNSSRNGSGGQSGQLPMPGGGTGEFRMPDGAGGQLPGGGQMPEGGTRGGAPNGG